MINKTFRIIIYISFVGLILMNIAVFVNGVKLSDDINYYEDQITHLQQENLQLEKQVYKYDSVTYAASVAAELDYTPGTNTLYLDQPEYAYNR